MAVLDSLVPRYNRITPRVDSEQLSSAGARAMPPQQQPGRRLARAVRTGVAVRLTLLDGQLERIQRQRVAYVVSSSVRIALIDGGREAGVSGRRR